MTMFSLTSTKSKSLIRTRAASTRKLGELFLFGLTLLTVLAVNKLSIAPTLDDNILDRKSETLIVLHRAPFIAPSHRIPASFNDSTLSGNWGDWLWKYAAHIILDHNKSLICKTNRDHCIQENSHVKRVVHYHPFANDLMEKWRVKGKTINKHLTKAYNVLIRYENDVLLPLGLGTQAYFGVSRSQSNLGLQNNFTFTSKDAQLDSTSVLFLNEMQRRKQVSFFRGSFTNEVAKNYGYSFGLEAGCPTLFINLHTNLGQNLQNRYESVSKRVADWSLKVAFNSSPSSPLITKLIVRLLGKYRNSLIFPQEAKELAYLESLGVPFDRIRVFNGDIVAWIAALNEMDVAFGPRIHGSMAAISATLPAFVVAPDHRVLELASVMNIPHTHIFDNRLTDEELDVAAFIRDSQFDGHAFDKKRCELAKLYVREFSDYRIHLAQHVKDISGNC